MCIRDSQLKYILNKLEIEDGNLPRRSGKSLPGIPTRNGGGSITNKPKKTDPDGPAKDNLSYLKDARDIILAQFEYLDRQLAQGDVSIKDIDAKAKLLMQRLNTLTKQISNNPVSKDPATLWRMSHGMTPGLSLIHI